MASKSRMSALAALKAKRRGESIAQKDDSDSDVDLYDEVNDEEFKSIVRGRMMTDNFIVDDDGGGYVDTGAPEWEREGSEESDGEDEVRLEAFGTKSRRGKRSLAEQNDYVKAAGAKKDSRKPPSTGSGLFGRGGSSARPLFGGAKQNTAAQDDDFMSNIFNDLESGTCPTKPTTKASSTPAGNSTSRKRRNEEAAFERFRTTHVATITSSSPHTEELPSSDSVESPADAPMQHNVRVLDGKDYGSPSWDHEGLASSPLPTKKLKTSAFTRQASISDIPPLPLTPEFSDDDDEDSILSIRKAAEGKARPAASNMRISRVQVSAPASTKTEAYESKTPSLGKNGPQSTAHKQSNAKANVIGWRDIHASLVQAEKLDEADKKGNPAKMNMNGSGNVASSDPQISDDEGEGSADKDATAKATYFEQTSNTVHFYWLDHLEQGDKVYLIGKVRSKQTGQYVSCCVAVEGMERCLFVLPKKAPEEQGLEQSRAIRESKKLRKERERKGESTDDIEDMEEEEEPWQDEVFDEFDSIRSQHGINSFISSWVVRDYAFELSDVPRESKYLKVRYGFDEPALPFDISGNTFSRVFGTNTSAFELFVLKRRIMGPCWLKLESASINTGTPISWCKLELTVDEPKSVSTFSDSDSLAPKETPPLNVMSLSLRTVVNVKENKKEILCASARTWINYGIEDTTPLEKVPSSLHTFVRALGAKFPSGFEQMSRMSKTKMVAIKYERGLLNALLAHIRSVDPDVILGHELVGVTLDVLLHRMRDLKAAHWSQIGRLRRPKWPPLRQNFNVPLLAGRLVLDLASDCGKSMITSTTWSLTEMAGTHLGIQREDIDPDETAGVFVGEDAKQVMLFLAHNDMDTWLQMAIACKVQILPLTKQLTNIAGNSWNRTLNGGRAERNEYILLHDFHEKKYICPDKLSLKDKRGAARKAAEEGAEEGADAQGSSKKDKFKGGLVFEPKKGLCDKFVLVMDFNSLYPSIIQEFNIDFTTVVRAGPAFADVDAIPDIPSSDVERGVLPTLIAKLVDKRRDVKGLMKDKKASAASLAQWNVKQLALKLTANSMYGCLGFENSRFYARPLAALTTFKGREILTQTRELAESLSLEVIYGDTDSVMINTNVTEYAEAIKIGREFKKAVNKRYRLLEIDIDAVFQRMLLLQKKKYAALKIEDDGKMTKEIKGLDMKRREYSMLSKDASAYVLDQVLSGEPTEVVIENVHEFLRKLGKDVRSSQLPLDAFIIYKRLGKNPEDYPDAKSQPHVQVALRMKAKGSSARSGDVIPYIFCKPEGNAALTKSAQADRAFHPDELRRAESKLVIDYEHYLSLQVLPPIERLCESIEGTDKARLAECLGLDTSRYAYVTSEAMDRDSAAFSTLDSQMTAEERFKDCRPLEFHCRACGDTIAFAGLFRAHQKRIMAGDHLRCPRSECRSRIPLPSLGLQLQQRIAEHIATYYAGWMVCSDSGCGLKSRLTGVYAKRCLAPGCHGLAVQVYSDKALYTQLSYYAHLFDGEALQQSAEELKHPGTAAQVLSQHKVLVGTLSNVVKQYLEKSGRKYVDLGSLFAGVSLGPRRTVVV
ncbi:hypothetical protein K437DRAFT_274495 [Tilletiaria anomala UBC 951]|uniref:DNA polymerase n=1 Tax=Tilletiaria anomala (strain ATCC 24038 / CBS 436.72 / UBC 951) TaxID=1037660 RepID=A0A066W0V9_TILAU|nr:uncharacterized protein K437DRAFT_274495 [Tilletiaria anomala UBC 951]KDN44709.1 hypothetical protein K437DRAFT_274495 [Tilletiaria anomala UBC 951]